MQFRHIPATREGLASYVNEGPHHGGLFPSAADVHKVWEIVNHFPILPIDEVVSSSDAVRDATSLHSSFDAKIRMLNRLLSSFQNEIANTALLGLAFSPPAGQKLRRFFDFPAPTLEFRASVSHPLLDSNRGAGSCSGAFKSMLRGGRFEEPPPYELDAA
ncbi:hypothetical protein DKX38_006028 [Salix brachista]|uniref:Uncharacterized protein n=1 Tax=Salix brachista TaxID=2182728 RepID=A0A5N5N3P1_9ROSI|nr:hypothetical protein DKX38_006028 [Salix brachista]